MIIIPKIIQVINYVYMDLYTLIYTYGNMHNKYMYIGTHVHMMNTHILFITNILKIMATLLLPLYRYSTLFHFLNRPIFYTSCTFL